MSFQGLGIAPKILEILSRLNFTIPTPIQQQSIPPGLDGKDIIGIAQTGTGKTLAFGIPMIQTLLSNPGDGLIIVPTRELAVQVNESIHQLAHLVNMRSAVLIGGENFNKQLKQLRSGPRILIATPGRLIDHLKRRTIILNFIKVLVLDEADRMLDMGFAPQIKIILQQVPPKRQTMLFSATMPAAIINLATRYMKLPVRVEVAPTGSIAKGVSQEIFFVEKSDKINLLKKLLGEYKGSTLIFTRTKFEAKKITRVIREAGHKVAEIHSNRSLHQRLDALNGFKHGLYRVLVATDIAARGIDVSGIELVLNFDLPAIADDYVHRIGRTARAGLTGHAISFAMPHQRADIKRIERFIGMNLRVSPVHIDKTATHARPPTAYPQRTRRRFYSHR